jgi:lipopolysaccharide export system protein LptA
MKKISILLVLLFIVSSLFSENKDFQFSSDSTSISLAEGNELTKLTGNAKISSEDTIITANSIELFGEDFRFARCSGNVRVTDTEQGILINTEALFFDREKEIMTINSYAEMIDQKNEIVVKGSYFENRARENITIIQIGVRILIASDNDSMTCRSEYAKYNREEEILELSGMPIVYWKDDVYQATKISINLENDDITLTGEVSGTIKTEDDTEEPSTEEPTGEQ